MIFSLVGVCPESFRGNHTLILITQSEESIMRTSRTAVSLVIGGANAKIKYDKRSAEYGNNKRITLRFKIDEK